MPVITTTDLDVANNDDGPSDGLGNVREFGLSGRLPGKNVLDTTASKTRKPGDRPSLA
ncbi:hypothetical protein [Phyllobacterium bourgognense]|uniref:Uncharacterized protein n=1 Tax=Phyllobacterium bourgognense TaxID=314236 RepID=A0A368YKN4_9HYPH|nr:hypothetical protein [Phyllobacterium bourgognense]RCW80068.1 hypothetical protein C7476_11533 [Phyllobacterium bourgognense]